MHKRRKDIQKFEIKNSDGVIDVYEYGSIDPGLDVAISVINGKYPGGDKYARNTKVLTMTYYVVNGSGIFRFKGEKPFEIKSGDCVFIGKDRWYQAESKSGKHLKF